MTVDDAATSNLRTVHEDQPDGTTEIRLELDGTPVSSTLIFPMLIRIGEAVLRMDGIGSVATDEAHRYRGHSRRVMETAVETMQAGDAAIATLYGIPDFYHRFGFATAGAEHTVTLPTSREADGGMDLPDGWALRAFTPDDLPAVAALYRETTALATSPVPRLLEDEDPAALGTRPPDNPAAITLSRRAWRHLLRVAGDDECRVLTDSTGAIAGYAWLGNDTWWVRKRQRTAPSSFHIGEAMARDPVAADALLAACLAWAREAMPDADTLELIIPPEGPLAHTVAYEGGAFVQQHTRHGEFMARILDMDRFARQMLPELDARVRRCHSPFQGNLTLRTELGSTTLAIGADGVSIGARAGQPELAIELPQSELARMVFGAFDVVDLLARLPDPPGQEAIEVLTALFPRRAPHIYPVDRF